jgi:hypothetical protein
MDMLKFLNKYIGAILLISACIIALTTYQQYGLSWDEGRQRLTGLVNYLYVVYGDQGLLSYSDRDYGVAFELPLIFIEKALRLEHSRHIFLARHLFTHFFFLIGASFCFLLVDFLYKNKLLASIAFLLVMLSPRLYAHSFFNTKDIPFMAMFLICFYLNAIAFNTKKIKHFLLLGIGVGLLINLRIMGVLLLGCVLLFLMMDYFLERRSKNNDNHNIQLALCFLVTALVTLYITWPFLWANPFENFAFAFKNMSKFRWDGSVLFNGQFIKATELNWNYIPVWFSITTPILYIIIGLWGLLLVILNFSKHPYNYLSDIKVRNNLFFLICFVSPVAAVIILKSVLYDGWRQMFFIYPSFVLLGIYGLNFLFKTRIKNIVLTILLLNFCFVGYFMFANIPFQHVYFNELVDKNSPEYLRKRFELDYWGTSYKQSFEYILDKDNSLSIDIAVANLPGKINRFILPPEKQKRINIVNIKNAKYFITNYRWHPQDYKEIGKKQWHSIKVNNNTINAIYKIK